MFVVVFWPLPERALFFWVVDGDWELASAVESVAEVVLRVVRALLADRKADSFKVCHAEKILYEMSHADVLAAANTELPLSLNAYPSPALMRMGRCPATVPTVI